MTHFITRPTNERKGDTEMDSEVSRRFRSAETILTALMLAGILWLSNTTYQNTILLTTIAKDLEYSTSGQSTSIQTLKDEVKRIDKHLDTIWPRLREIKDHIIILEAADTATEKPWKY